jgi:hypothetical protein
MKASAPAMSWPVSGGRRPQNEHAASLPLARAPERDRHPRAGWSARGPEKSGEGSLGSGITRQEPDVVVSTEAKEYVSTRGGVLFVRSSHPRCCGGGLTLVESTTVAPSDASDFLFVGSDGIEVKYRCGAVDRPHEIVIELRGMVRRRPVAYWDGCAFTP